MPPKPISNISSSFFTILSGKYRRKKLPFYGDTTLRPTPNRVRETLFNWLQFDIVNTRVLDCFAGSGALGFEAYSRGASSVTLIEQNPETADVLRNNSSILHASTNHTQELNIIQSDFFHAPLEGVYDIVFIDPPFHKQLTTPSLYLIKKYIHKQSLIYIESEYPFSLDWLETVKNKKAGEVYYSLNRIITTE